MRVLMVNNLLFPQGEAGTYTVEVGRKLSEMGHTVEYFGMFDRRNVVGSSDKCCMTNAGVEEDFPRKFHPLGTVYSFEAKKKLSALIEVFEPDIIHINDINFSLTPSVTDAAATYGIPVVQTVHDYAMVCPNRRLFDFRQEQICEKCLGGGSFSCIKNKCVHDSMKESIVRAVESRVYRILPNYKKVDRFICPSRFLEQKLLSSRPGVFGTKTEVLPYCAEESAVDPVWLDAEKKLRIKYVLFAGEFDSDESVAIFAGTAKRLPDVRFVAATREEEAFKGLKNITCVGPLSGKPLRELTARATMFFAAAVRYDSMTRAVRNAVSLGTPVICSDIGSLSELVENGKTGIPVKNNSDVGFANALRGVMTDDKALSTMFRNCIASRNGKNGLAEYCEKLLEVYENVLSGTDEQN